MMSYKTFKKVILLLFCSVILYVTGLHVFSMEQIATIKDALLTIVFFICVFPFGFMFLAISKKIIKSISLTFNNYLF